MPSSRPKQPHARNRREVLCREPECPGSPGGVGRSVVAHVPSSARLGSFPRCVPSCPSSGWGRSSVVATSRSDRSATVPGPERPDSPPGLGSRSFRLSWNRRRRFRGMVGAVRRSRLRRAIPPRRHLLSVMCGPCSGSAPEFVGPGRSRVPALPPVAGIPVRGSFRPRPSCWCPTAGLRPGSSAASPGHDPRLVSRVDNVPSQMTWSDSPAVSSDLVLGARSGWSLVGVTTSGSAARFGAECPTLTVRAKCRGDGRGRACMGGICLGARAGGAGRCDGLDFDPAVVVASPPRSGLSRQTAISSPSEDICVATSQPHSIAATSPSSL